MPKGWRLWGVTQLEDRRYYLFQAKALPAGDGEWSLDVLFGDRTYGIGTDFRFFVIAVQADSKEDLELAARPHGSAEPLPQGGLCRSEPITVRRVGPVGYWYADYWDMSRGELRFSENVAGRFLFKNWEEESPAAELPKDNWSARFVRRVQFPRAGPYRFYAERDDGVRVWLDSQLVINAWEGGALVRETKAITLTQGYHEIAVDFFDGGEAAALGFWYEGPEPRPEIPPLSSSYWRVSYYPNEKLRNEPVWYETFAPLELNINSTCAVRAGLASCPPLWYHSRRKPTGGQKWRTTTGSRCISKLSNVQMR